MTARHRSQMEARPDAANVVLEDTEFGQDIRWRPGERLEQLFEEQCDRKLEAGLADHLAVDAGDEALTYQQLDGRANRLARYLLDLGVGPGERVALLVDRAVEAYVGMLAVLKAGAAYVPLDAGFPPDRLSYITADAGVGVVLSVEHLRSQLAEVDAQVVCLDAVVSEIEACDDGRLRAAERGEAVDELAYIIYTSGSTGRPKGVAVEHASICNFVRVAAQVYGVRQGDRMYQGLTIAFDFSVEEIWVPWMVGATLVPRPPGPSLLGPELREFLAERGVTAMCCVPTLLATLDEDLPDLRFLLVSGEACPHDLIVRWHRPGRRFLNVYGPTEATVTATWTAVHPDRAVTIGVPLPTYSVVILDTDNPGRVLPPGETGEIGIAGIGLAAGYVNRDDLTAAAFVPDPLGLPRNPSGRIYRTGDLGRVNGDGELDYLGRIDLQVKIRGYRIELTEIESVLLQVPGIAQAVVDTYEPVPGTTELVGYYSLRHDTPAVDHEEVYAMLRDRLPSYMVPAYLEHLPVIPMTTSDKADRKRLPPPTSRSLAEGQEHRPPTTTTENVLAGALARTLGLDRVSVDSHFFDDLGANSLLMAQFSARVRNESDYPSLSMREIYRYPTISALAATIPVAASGATNLIPHEPASPEPRETIARAGALNYVLCGALQLLAFFGYCYLTAWLVLAGFTWIGDAASVFDEYERVVWFGSLLFLALSVLPVVVKWLLIGRWRPDDIRVWSLRYFRFWLVKTLLRFSPMRLFAGSPLYNLYLRLLGAKIGRGAVIFSRNTPICTDLLSIGHRSVVRKDSFFSCYRARSGMIQIGSVTLGDDVVVGEMTVFDIGTSMGDDAQLGHTSSLQEGQTVPDGQRWHGSPAVPTEVDYRRVEPAACTPVRRIVYGILQLCSLLLLSIPLTTVAVMELLRILGTTVAAITTPAFFAAQLAFSAVLFFGAVLVGLIVVCIVPRFLARFLEPGVVYPLYGVRYALERAIGRISNVKFFTFLFGDSSYIVAYLRGIGYDLSKVEQTGSNFGMAVKHDTPALCGVGTGTMVSDGLSMINTDFSATSFRVMCTTIGAHNFLGNNIAYPAGGRTGENCLLGTKVMVPLDGPVRADVGLLGSPSFEIPRSVQRDTAFKHLGERDEFRHRLAAKNRHNVVTIVLFLLVRWFSFFLLAVILQAGEDLTARFGAAALAGALVASFVVNVVYFVLVDRAVTGFQALRPRFCSIYDSAFWRHERFWKVPAMAYVQTFDGTPFKNLVWRALGVRIGRRVFDDGSWMTERSLVEIGDYCTLNAGATLQSHSLEDGTFKSDRIRVGTGCTIGAGAFVHYGVRIFDAAELGPDSFLMKGEEMATGANWRGNPAAPVRALATADHTQIGIG